MRPWSLIALLLVTCSPQSQQEVEVASDLGPMMQGRRGRQSVVSDWKLSARAQGPWWRFSLRRSGLALGGDAEKNGPVTLRLKSQGEVIDVHLTEEKGIFAGLAFLKRGPVYVLIYEGEQAIGEPVAEGRLTLGERAAPLWRFRGTR